MISEDLTQYVPILFYTSDDDYRVHLIIGELDIQLHEAPSKRLLDHICQVLAMDTQLNKEPIPPVVFSTSGQFSKGEFVGIVTILMSRYGASDTYNVLVILDYELNSKRARPMLSYNYVNENTILSIKGQLESFYNHFFSHSGD